MRPPLQVFVVESGAQRGKSSLRAVQRCGHIGRVLKRPADLASRRGRVGPDIILFSTEAWRAGGGALLAQLAAGTAPVRAALLADARTAGRAGELFDQGVQAVLVEPLSEIELGDVIDRLMAGPPASAVVGATSFGATPGDVHDDDELESTVGPLEDDEERDVIGDSPIRDSLLELVAEIRAGNAHASSISPVSMELHAMCADEEVSMGALLDRVEQDSNLAASVLKASNATAYRGLPRVLDLAAAGRRLGTRRLAEVAQLEAIKGAFSSPSRGWSALLGRMWRTTVTTARATRALAEALGMHGRGELYSMALFHNLGEVLVVDLHRREGSPPPRKGLAAGVLAHDMDEQHAVLGGLLLRSWGLPAAVSSIAFAHHDPTQLPSGTPLARHAWMVAGCNEAVLRAGYTYKRRHCMGPALEHVAEVTSIPVKLYEKAAQRAVDRWTGVEP